MQNAEPRPVRTGGDPRLFPDFVALRDEMSKLAHPARPDILWDQVEILSLSMFEKNGIELQTGAWYTLARSHLASNTGMLEGVMLIEAMLSHQWTLFWPQSPHARVEILTGLFLRLQKIFRTFILNHEDKQPLLQLESALVTLSEILAHQDLLQVSQITPLQQQVRSALTRLDNVPDSQMNSAIVTLPVENTFPQTSYEKPSPVPRLRYVIAQSSSTNVEVVHETPAPSKQIGVFLGGMFTAFMISSIAFGGWYYLHRPDTTEKILARTLQPLPRTLDSAAMSELKYNEVKTDMASQWIKQASVRLNELGEIPPDWHIRYAQDLVTQANILWPWRSDAKQLGVQWQQGMAVNEMSIDTLYGWHNGMMQLQRLAGQLNALDSHKGKYLTVSELKSKVFSAIQAFNQTVPLEEQLRDISGAEGAKMVSEAQKMQAEQHLKQLIARYSALTRTNQLISPRYIIQRPPFLDKNSP